MVSKKSLIRMLACSLVGYALIHPLIMLISFLMSDHPHTITGLASTSLITEIYRSFSIPMLPWSLSFALLGGLIGFYFDKKRQADEDKLELIIQLQASLSEVKKLSGLLPICAACKNIRDDTGYWNQIETYIKEHSEAEFTHGICPDCAKKLYPEFMGNSSKNP